MKPIRLLAVIIAASIGCCTAAWAAEPPGIVNYQGVLRSGTGSPLNGSYDMIFRFFDTESGSGELLADAHTGAGAVAVSGGVFSLQLGGGVLSGPTASLTELLGNFSTVYLEVDVQGQTLSPRIRIVSSFYALNAASLEGKVPEDFIDVAGSQVKTGNLTLDGTSGGGNLLINGGGKLRLNAIGSDLIVEHGSKLMVADGGDVILDGTTGGGSLSVLGGGDVTVQKGSKLLVQDGGDVILDGTTGGGSLSVLGGGDVTVQKGSKLLVQDGGDVILDGTTGGGSLSVLGGGDVTVQKGSKLLVQDGGDVILDGTTGGGSLSVLGGGDVTVQKGSKLLVQDGGDVILDGTTGGGSLSVLGGGDVTVQKGSKLLVQDGGDVILDGTTGGGSLSVLGGGDVTVQKGSKLLVQDGGDVILDGTTGGGSLSVLGGGDVTVQKGSKLLVQDGGDVILDGTTGGGSLSVLGGGDVTVQKGSKLLVQDGGDVILDGTTGGGSLSVLGGGDVTVQKGSKLLVQDGGDVILDGTTGGGSLSVLGGGDVTVQKGSKLLVQDGGDVILDGTTGGGSLSVLGGGDVTIQKGSKLLVHDGGDVVLDGTSGGGTLKVQGGGNIVVKGVEGQIAPLQQWQDSTGAVLAAVSASGGLSGDGSALTSLTASNLSSGTVPNGRITGIYSSQVSFSSASNSFTGDGSGLTGVSAVNAQNADMLDGLDSTALARLASPNTFIAGTQTVQTGAADVTGLVVKGAVGQTVALQQWQDSTGAVLAAVSAGGGLSGDGSALANLSATNLASGTVPNGRIAGTYSNQVSFSNASNSLTGSGAGLSNLNASNLASGTLPSGRFSGTYSNPVTFSSGSNSFTGNGAGLTNLNAANSNHANVADFGMGINEVKVAEVRMGSRGAGPLPPGSAVYADPVTAMNDLPSWCGLPSQSAPCLLRIMPGTYELGDNLNLQPWVHIMGSGTETTRLKCSNPVLGIAPHAELSFLTLEGPLGADPVLIANAGAFRHLSIVQTTPTRTTELVRVELGMPEFDDVSIVTLGVTGILSENASPMLRNIRISGPSGGSIVNDGSSPTMTDVTIELGGTGPPATLIGVKNANDSNPVMHNVMITGGNPGQALVGISNQTNSSPRMTNVWIRVTAGGTVIGVDNSGSSNPIMDNCVIEVGPGPSTSIGVQVNGSSLEMTGVTVRASSSNAARGILINSGSSVKVDHCAIAASGHPGAFSIQKAASTSSLFVGATKLEASVSSIGVLPSCVFNYNGNYQPLNSSCQ